jgi:hypothetical protein
MATALKPVDDSPICSPDDLQRIDPVWTRGRVPSGFWKAPAHRRDFLLWLADRLGFRCMADLYRLQVSSQCPRNGGGSLVTYWHCSSLAAVQECFPDYDWKPWLFSPVPAEFWDSPANRRAYLDWLGDELGFRTPQAWTLICSADFRAHGGEVLLRSCGSLYDLMREYLPEIAWDRIDKHRPIRVEDVLAWADAHFGRHGRWPTLCSGVIAETGDTWQAINHCLRSGRRGLPSGTSLARFLAEHRGVGVRKGPPPLSEGQILAWADAHSAAHGNWPSNQCGSIAGTPETWPNVDQALRKGLRGLGGGTSLARLLARRRGKLKHDSLPPLTEEQILAWADAYFVEHGKWPKLHSGAIPATRENWHAIDQALRKGSRGLSGGSSLPRLLTQRRGAPFAGSPPPLTEEQILAWADAYFAAHGKWPGQSSGPVKGTCETWRNINGALHLGLRGLPRGLSLARLLARRRGTRNLGGLPALSEKQILAWADAHFRHNRKWPNINSGPVAGTAEDWSTIDGALRRGNRGLPRRFSLAKLLAERRGARNRMALPPLSEAKILAWAHRFRLEHGHWPHLSSGPIPQSPGDTWKGVDDALRKGCRGLPGGSSLTKLLIAHGLK